MSFSDILKKGFLENFQGDSDWRFMLISLVIAFATGMFIFFIYKMTYQGVMYNRQFGVSLVALDLIATFIILGVTSNVVLSLGMVGALSIVRFRTAIKDPLDLVFLFWAIGVGIVLGANLYLLAIIGTLVVGIILLIFVKAKSAPSDFILVVECKDDAAEKRAAEIVKEGAKRCAIKSKTVARGYIEVSYEVKLAGDDTEFVNKVSAAEGVDKAVLVSYNGDYMA